MSPWLGALRRRGAAARSQPAPRPVAGREPRAPAPAPLGARVRFTINTVRSLKEAPKSPEEIEAGTAALNPEGAVPADVLHRVLVGDDGAAEDLTAVQLRTLADLYELFPAYYRGTDAEIESIDASLEFMAEYRDPATGTPYICGGWESLTPSRMRSYSAIMRVSAQHAREHSTAVMPGRTQHSASQPSHHADVDPSAATS